MPNVGCQTAFPNDPPSVGQWYVAFEMVRRMSIFPTLVLVVTLLGCDSVPNVGPCAPREVGGSWCAVAIVSVTDPAGLPVAGLRVRAHSISPIVSGAPDAPSGTTDDRGHLQLEWRWLALPPALQDSVQLRLHASTPTTGKLVDSLYFYVHLYPVGGAYKVNDIRWQLLNAS